MLRSTQGEIKSRHIAAGGIGFLIGRGIKKHLRNAMLRLIEKVAQ